MSSGIDCNESCGCACAVSALETLLIVATMISKSACASERHNSLTLLGFLDRLLRWAASPHMVNDSSFGKLFVRVLRADP